MRDHHEISFFAIPHIWLGHFLQDIPVNHMDARSRGDLERIQHISYLEGSSTINYSTMPSNLSTYLSQ